MDVVDGKIVSAGTERSELWSGIKPSSGNLLNKGISSPDSRCETDQPPSCATMRVVDEVGDWAASIWRKGQIHGQTNFGEIHFKTSFSSDSSVNDWSSKSRPGALPASKPSMVLSNGTGRIRGTAIAGMLGTSSLQRPAASGNPPKQQSMAPYPTAGLLRPPTTTFQGPCRSRPESHDHHGHHGGDHHNVATLFDKEMTMYESQIARTAYRNVRRLPLKSVDSHRETPLTPSGTPESSLLDISSKALDISTSPSHISVAPSPETKAGCETASVCTSASLLYPPAMLCNQKPQSPSGSPVPTRPDLKRRSSESNEDHGACTWTEPLRFLVRKGLTVSDVGELGRVVLPKKDAEGQLPRIDNKEGILLTMDDYDSKRHWVFRYKWWLNNKSRMYVLENTGEFIKHHKLKENDALFVYEDAFGKLVIRGEKVPSRDITSNQYDPCVQGSSERQFSEGLNPLDKSKTQAASTPGMEDESAVGNLKVLVTAAR